MYKHSALKSYKRFQKLTAGILSAVILTGSILTNYVGLTEKPLLSAVGEKNTTSDQTETFSVKEIAPDLKYTVIFKSNAQWCITFSGNAEIPANILSAEEFNVYRDNIDEVVIGSDIIGIAAHAFEGAEGLHIVNFEENHILEKIGQSAFKDCAYLSTINLENCKSLKTLGEAELGGRDSEYGVFTNSGLTSITIPSSVETIGKDTFCRCSKLSTVEFEEDSQVTLIGAKAFAYCTALESVNLEDCTARELTFKNIDNEAGAFYGCSSLIEVTIPSGVTGEINGIFINCTSLRKITFEENDNQITNVTQIIRGTAVDILDFTPLKGLTYIDSWQIRGNMTKVIIPDTITGFGVQSIGENHSLTTVEFAENNKITKLGDSMFQDDPALSWVNMEALTNLQFIGNTVFDRCSSLAAITIPTTVTSIGNQVFRNCSSLISLTYNAEKLEYVGIDIFEKVGAFDLFIGPDVKEIPIAFLLQAQPHVSDYQFAPNISFTVGNTGTSTGLSAPFSTGGYYCTDEQGNLYMGDDNGTVKLIYANSMSDEITIPANTIGGTVTGIARDAFKNSNIQNLTIESPENITKLEDYAFARARLLTSINNEKNDSDILALFTNESCSKGGNLFYNTNIQSSSGNAIEESVFPGGAKKAALDATIAVSRSNVTTLNYHVNLDQTISKEEDEDRVGKYWWTGRTATLMFGYRDDNPVRIYIRAEDGFEVLFNDNNVRPTPTGIDGIYYYDIKYESASTGKNSISLSYPNLSAPGSKVQVWAVEFDSHNAYTDYFAAHSDADVIYPGTGNQDGTYIIPDQYFELEWTTKPINFTLKKEHTGITAPGFVVAADGKVTLDSLKYQIEFCKANPEEKDISVGYDIVRYVDYTDTLTLPDELIWREEIFENIENTRFIHTDNSGTLYITIDDIEYELFSLTEISNIVDMSVKPLGGNRYSLCWRVVNPKTDVEIPTMQGYLTIGSEVLVAKNEIAAGDSIGLIKNDLGAEEYYTFSEMKTGAADDQIGPFSAPLTDLKLTKERITDASCMGEDIQYKIIVENPSAFPYPYLDLIVDSLNSDGTKLHYLKPEAMQALFDDPAHGQYLSITIGNAILAKALNEGQSVVKAVNDTDVTISVQDSANENDQLHNGIEDEKKGTNNDHSVAHRDVTITIRKNGDSLVLTCVGADINKTLRIGTDCADIAAALDSIGYIVTSVDSYLMQWNYPTGYKMPANSKIEFIINTSIKDSLMYLPELEEYYYYAYPDKTKTFNIYNSVNLYSIDGGNNLSSSTWMSSKRVGIDLEINKTAYVNGEQFDQKTRLRDGDILDYSVAAIHHGSGSYDVLPVVDHMTGLQAVIVRADDNQNAVWKDHATELILDNVKYYVLNQEYTYQGVYTSEFYAHSIRVKKTDTGLDTLLKYYIENTPGREFKVDVTYRAISSQALAGNEFTSSSYSISNEAWLNDRPGHRIYDTMGGGSSAIQFDKKILIGDTMADPNDEKLLESFPIKQSENVVTYRLMLHNTSSPVDENGNSVNADTTITVTQNDIYDKLPLTGSAFDWIWNDTIEASIRYRVTEGMNDNAAPAFARVVYGETEIVGESKHIGNSDGSEWEITSSSPSSLPENAVDSDQQYLVWKEGFKIVLPAKATVYMYITLKFPGGDQTDNWKKFLEEKGIGEPLINTFYLYELPASVTHTLSDTAVALLQKGVYDTGTYIADNGFYSSSQYYWGKDRYYYSNTYPNGRLKNTVTYYVILRNSGNTPLYLAPVYDILPPGFEYMAMRVGDGTNVSWNHVGNNEDNNTRNNSPTQDGGIGKILVKPMLRSDYDDWSKLVKPDSTEPTYNAFWNETDGFVQTKVFFTESQMTSDGRQMLKFEFANGDDKNGLSQDENGNYYLQAGEYIQFGYTVYTGNKSITEAENTVVMQYYDPHGSGAKAEQDKKTPVVVKDYNNTDTFNDGSRDVWQNDYAKQSGFENVEIKGGNENPEWFASSVTVKRSKISPGVHKEADYPLVSAGNNAGWTVTCLNNSPTAISGYTITDTLDSPLQFSGDFSYTIYGPDDKMYTMARHNAFHGTETDHLFSIVRNGASIKVYSNMESKDTGGHVLDPESDEPVELYVGLISPSYMSSYGSGTKITVQLKYDENHNEQLIVGFPDAKWDIMPYGYSKLKFSTTSTTTIDPGFYTNHVMFSPYDDTYVNITEGQLIKDTNGKNLGVASEAVVSIYAGSLSYSTKMIEETEDPNNNASCLDKINYIRLMDKKDHFTYTLEVQNPDRNSPMENLVIIDNLPEKDDVATMNPSNKRNSAFKVNLADDPKVEILLYTIEENDSTVVNTLRSGIDYIVGYNDKSTGFVDDDWNGTKQWDSEPSEGTRSLRIQFLSTTNIPPQAKVQVRFEAVIDANDRNAVPGTIAWNNFGYNYKVGNTLSKASPPKVGICIPGVTTLSKKVVDTKGNSALAAENTVFEFIIYESDTAVEFSDYREATVMAALKAANKNFMYLTLTVEAGQSESETVMLEKFKKFVYHNDDTFSRFDEVLNGSSFWDTEKTYYVAELSSSEEYSYQSTNGETDANNYSFRIDPIKNTPLQFVNAKMQNAWRIQLTKTNEHNQPLKGALFGIYTEDENRKMTDEAFSALDIDENRKTITKNNGTVYYLMDAVTSPTDGIITWDDLDGDMYIVTELKAPEGYCTDSTLYEIAYSDATDGMYELTVMNLRMINLPETGGTGTKGFEMFGMLLMCVAVLFLCLRHKEKRV